MTFLYLGSPYSHPDPAVQEERYNLVLTAMAEIAQFRIPVYCPIAIWHPAALAHKLPGDHLFWEAQDEAFLRSCYMGWFLTIPGHDSSSGIKMEKEKLSKMGKPFWDVSLDTLTLSCEDLLRRGAFDATRVERTRA